MLLLGDKTRGFNIGGPAFDITHTVFLVLYQIHIHYATCTTTGMTLDCNWKQQSDTILIKVDRDTLEEYLRERRPEGGTYNIWHNRWKGLEKDWSKKGCV